MLANLTNTCPACGAEESLDGLIQRLIDDDQVRRLLADVLTTSLPLGGQVVRYLRLHKPAKQRLRMDKIRVLLQELIPAIQAQRITRHGRDWVCGQDGWRAAFYAVFARADKGELRLPLDGNAYLFGVITNLVDKHESGQEKATQHQQRSRAHSSNTTANNIAALATSALQAQGDDTLARLNADRAASKPPSEEIRQKLREARAKLASAQAAKEVKP